ncbi:hypothetical protein P7K49_023067 [Saguinus oedipus]|uniref:Uncharacterized protein n=1 Tax=Saguinus oedipus TaxID=9490 RepID=A0ABQ9UKN2_SAGOE|nr:hypothetical protein P7K49_023067 [Saguinus oedipus]
MKFIRLWYLTSLQFLRIPAYYSQVVSSRPVTPPPPDFQIPDKRQDMPLSVQLYPTLSVPHGELAASLRRGKPNTAGAWAPKALERPQEAFCPLRHPRLVSQPLASHFLLDPYWRLGITRPPRPVEHGPKNRSGVDTQGQASSPAPGEKGRARGRPRRLSPRTSGGLAWLPGNKQRGLTSRLVLRLSPSAIVSEMLSPRAQATFPAKPPAKTHTATTEQGNAPKTAYIGCLPFPTDPAILAPHWTG